MSSQRPLKTDKELRALSVLTEDISSVDAKTWEELREFQAAYGKAARDKTKELKKGVNDISGLLQKLEEIKMGGDFAPLPWIEHVSHVGRVSLEVKLGEQAKDEFARESAFVEQALDTAQECYEHLEELNVPYKRPDDYYAEMLKTDTHMANIRRHLLAQQKRIEVVEERKKKRDSKKYGREVQQEKERSRDERKRAQMDSLHKWRKQGKPDANISDEQFLVSLERDSAVQRTSEKRGREKETPLSYKQLKKQRTPNPKRQAKNAKYGFGGPQRRKKSNNKDSFANTKGFDSAANKRVPHHLKSKMPKKAGSRTTKRR